MKHIKSTYQSLKKYKGKRLLLLVDLDLDEDKDIVVRPAGEENETLFYIAEDEHFGRKHTTFYTLPENLYKEELQRKIGELTKELEALNKELESN